MEHVVSLIPCSLELPKHGSCVEFWDWLGEKRLGGFIIAGINFEFFVETKTGHIFYPITEVTYWIYKG